MKPHNNHQICTIGHSNHTWERFLELLGAGRIEVVVDIRSSPYSRYSPHFNKNVLEDSLRRVGIKYVFLGNMLGGRPEGEVFYDDKGHVYYDQIEKSSSFKEGINRLLTGLKTYKLAVLCGEEDPALCHRRLLIGRVLSKYGVEVMHIRGDGRLQSEEELTTEEDYQKHKGQMSLFAVQETEEWKSIPSVSPKKARRNSLKP
ncbi:MAG: DUF488 domain-containing protein [Deltaproteobacteria bacterium]|nr:DUF488 domain-containing protein [Deltaproteobacteria bacterium]